MGFCTEDRKTEGIIPHLSVRENITIALLPKLNSFGFVKTKEQDEIVRSYIDRLKIKTPTPEQAICNLSGGNQQKVLLARWMCMNPKLMILDEPTRGIDVGAKAEIEQLIQEFSKSGISVLMISSEIAELERNCDRIIVMREGRVIGELAGDQISQDKVMETIARGSESEGKRMNKTKQDYLQFVKNTAQSAAAPVFVLLNSLFTPELFRIGNLNNVITQLCPTILCGMGMTLVISTGGIDISVGSVMALAGVLTARLMPETGLPAAVLAAVAVSVVVVALPELWSASSDYRQWLSRWD